MASAHLSKDPYNVIITGVGGQGNVLASRIVANMLVQRGYHVVIGESFGASQRGGSVMSHLRVSEKSHWSPQIPRGKADVVVSLEPIEAIRVLMDFGNPEVIVLSNTRPIPPVGVLAGDMDYPSLDQIKESARQLASKTWFIDATDEALKLGDPILSNVIMLGALSGLGILPLKKEDFEEEISKSIPEGKIPINMQAYDLGNKMVNVQ